MGHCKVLLAVAKFQRAVLDIHVWIDFVNVYQIRLCPSPNGELEKHDANQDLMGAFTEKVAVVQHLHSMGIPVWLIQLSFHILPTMSVNMPSLERHSDEIVLHHFADGMGNPDPYPVLTVGPP